MAEIDSQKQFLTLIRGFASESSQGERRIVDLKKRIEELRSEIVGANADLEDAKRVKETTEQDIKGYEVELAMNEASIQTLEARATLIQNDVSVAKSDLEALKVEEGALRDDFTERMLKMNATIRKFQETTVYAFDGKDCLGTSKNEDAEVVRSSLEVNLSQIVSQTIVEEQKYQAEQNIHKQAQQELIQLEEKLVLMEALLKESKELQELTRHLNLKFSLLHLEMSCRIDAYVPVAIEIMWKPWVGFFRQAVEVSYLLHYTESEARARFLHEHSKFTLKKFAALSKELAFNL